MKMLPKPEIKATGNFHNDFSKNLNLQIRSKELLNPVFFITSEPAETKPGSPEWGITYLPNTKVLYTLEYDCSNI